MNQVICKAPTRAFAWFSGRTAGMLALLASGLTACGGGEAPGSTPPPEQASSLCASGSTYATWTDPVARANKPAGAAVVGCGNTLSNVQWTQTGGPAVSVLAAQSQAVSFEPTASGTYGFDVTFTDRTGVPRTVPVSVVVAEANGTPVGGRILARLDHAVRGGLPVSVRAWPANLGANETVSNITWTQVAGPRVTPDPNTSRDLILFTSPKVAVDTLLQFRVTLTTTSGTDSDEVAVLVVPGAMAAINAAAVWGRDSNRDGVIDRIEPLGLVHAYRRNGPFASILVNCVYNAQSTYTDTATTLCPVRQLPLMGTQTSNGLPSIDEVMNRVVVSHDWMGENFEQFLTTQDANGDFRQLFNGVTAVVVGSHVRPSFYNAITGAIYLDADELWLTPAQRDVINEAPDYRAAFDDGLQYTGLWRYTVNNVRVPTYPAPTVRATRTQQSLGYGLGYLLYHELTHANDFFPASVRLNLNPTLGTLDNLLPRLNAAGLPSDTLNGLSRLASADLRGLACVKFFGLPANTAQTQFTATQVGNLFAVDGANDEYNYAVAPLANGSCNLTGTSREDIAMLMEEFLMASRRGAPRDVAFTSRFTPGLTGNDLIVGWGQRGRIGEPKVRDRVRAMVPLITPWLSTDLVDALPAPTPFRVGASWTSNLTPVAPRVNPLDADPNAAAKPAGTFAESRVELMRQFSGPNRGGAAAWTSGAGLSTSLDARAKSADPPAEGAVAPRTTPAMARRLGLVHP